MKPEPIEQQFMTLDEDEKAILDSVENEEWVACYDTSEEFNIRKNELVKAAQTTLQYEKDAEVIIHIPQKIFRKIEMAAKKSGLDYQNWITDTLQKVVNQ